MRQKNRESVKSGHHCCPCQAPPPPVLVTTSPSARIIRQSSQPEASACCCSGCCCNLHAGIAPSAASLRQLREPGDGIAGIAADSLRINGGIRQFRQVSRNNYILHFCSMPQRTITTTATIATTIYHYHYDHYYHIISRKKEKKKKITTIICYFLFTNTLIN